MRPLAILALLLSSPMVVGCGSSADEADAVETVKKPPREFDYPQDDELRLNHLQMKGTHNSYHVEKEGNTLPHWRYSHLPLDLQFETQGVRAIELDISYSAEKGGFEVFHIRTLDDESICPDLEGCVRAIAAWSYDHPAHHPLLVQIEPKDAPREEDAESYFQKLEATILGGLSRESIITPDDVRGDSATLRDAIVNRGWPTLREARGKVLFFIDDASEWRRLYTRGGEGLDGRLFFVNSSPDDPFAAVRVLNDPMALAEEIADSVKAGFLVRTRADSDGSRDEGQREAALASGAHIVSTDFPVAVADAIAPLEIPGGTPSRCNPLTAPANCSPEALENPKFMTAE